MPVERVPVVHKFGIISYSHRLALEERLAKKSLSIDPPPTFSRTRRQPYEVTEEFIAKFNDSNEEDRKDLEGVAFQMIARAKRRAGIFSGGRGDHVDLGRSWTELGLLAQCSSKEIQEESLELLICSLGLAPPSLDQLPSLFYLAKSSLHWLRKCGIKDSCLRTAELKLIKMGHLAFVRLYYHNMTQDLKGYLDEKQSMLRYLTGLPDEQEDVYRSFPGALLAVRYMKQVGRLICTGCDEPAQQNPAYTEAVTDGAEQSNQLNLTRDQVFAQEAPQQARGGLPLVPEEDEEGVQHQGSGEMGFNEAQTLSYPHTPAAASSIHDLSPTLWHALDVWRSIMYKGTGLTQALEGLSTCGTGLNTELWLDVCCAFQVLTEASKHDLAVLRTFQALAAGVIPRPAQFSDAHQRHLHLCDQCLSAITGHKASSVQDLPDLDFGYEMGKTHSASGYTSLDKTPSLVRGLRDFVNLGRGEKRDRHVEDIESVVSCSAGSKASSEASFADISSLESDRQENSGHGRESSTSTKMYRKTRKTTATKSDSSSESEDGSLTDRIKGTKPTDLPYKEVTKPPPQGYRDGTAVRFNVKQPEVTTVGSAAVGGMERALTKDSLCSGHTLGSSVTIPLVEEDIFDDKKSVKTATSELSSAPGLPGWRWELAYLYTDSMMSVCINGQSSTIQKTALLGSEANRKVTVFGKKNNVSREGLGLLDLLKIKFPVERDKTSGKDWSWKVRFAAVQALVRVSRHYGDDSTKDGLRGVAWNQLMRHHSWERDMRVLEAWKSAKIESELDSKLQLDLVDSSFPSWAAASMAAVLLPPLPPVVPLASVARPRSRVVPLSRPGRAVRKGPLRPSLRQEILLATAVHEPQADYQSRMNRDLMLVIEDQWRKELHKEKEQEETESREKEATKVHERMSRQRGQNTAEKREEEWETRSHKAMVREKGNVIIERRKADGKGKIDSEGLITDNNNMVEDRKGIDERRRIAAM